MRNTRNYDWLGLIRFNKATEDFLKYQRKHKNISVNRAARSFCLKKKYNLWSIFNADFCKALNEDEVYEPIFDPIPDSEIGSFKKIYKDC